MKKNSENKSIISTLFTDKQLKELEFTPEEIKMLEDAETTSQLIDLLPSTENEIEEFFNRFDKEFTSDNPVEILTRYTELPQKDPKFFNQILAMNLLIDEIEEVPAATTKKVSLEDINKEKISQETKARKDKFAMIDKVLKNEK